MNEGAADTVLIVDDHPLYRDALADALGRARPGSRTVFATSAAEALEAARAPEVVLVLLDLQLADASGFDTLVRMMGERPRLSVAIVSATETPDAYRRALSLGAVGYLPKSLALVFDTVTAEAARVIDVC